MRKYTPATPVSREEFRARREALRRERLAALGVHVPAPPPPPAGNELQLGTRWPSGEPFVLTTTQLRRHLHIIGVSGMGKSFFVAGLFRAMLQRGIAGAIIDPHGDLVDDVLA